MFDSFGWHGQVIVEKKRAINLGVRCPSFNHSWDFAWQWVSSGKFWACGFSSFRRWNSPTPQKQYPSQWRSQDFGSGGGNTLGGQPRGGSGGGAPRTPENFRKFSKNFFRKLFKMHYFSIFFKKVNKPCVNFSRVWTKNTNFWKILRNFRNFSKNFLTKLQKIHYFCIFFKKISKPMRSFFAVWTKNTNCWEILINFEFFW